MGKILKLGIVLFIITAVTGLILGGVYTMTLEPIRIAKEREKNDALAATLPGATDFEKIEAEDASGLITEVSRGTADGKLVGYNYTVMPKGYGGRLEIIVGVSKEGKLMAIKILKHTETPGLGAKADEEGFLSQFREKAVRRFSVTKAAASGDGEIQAISGATITSDAVVQGVNAALSYFGEHNSPRSIAPDGPDAVTSASKKKTESEAEGAAN